MSGIILHHNGVYNLFSTTVDSPLHEPGLTLAQLTEVIRNQDGQSGLDGLAQRLERAHRKGTSSGLDHNLASHVDTYNRRHHQEISLKEFIAKFMTLDPTVEEANAREASVNLNEAYRLTRAAHSNLPRDQFKKEAAALYSFLYAMFNPS